MHAKRTIRLLSLLVVSWLTMTLTHEIGHLVGGWLGGATLQSCDLVPWHLPYSIHDPDPLPRLTLWAGPILGVLIPMLFSWLVPTRSAQFIANFCLLANGTYLALAWLAGDRYLDTPRMLAAGVSPIALLLFCATTISVGYVRFRKDCIGVLSVAAPTPVQESQGGDREPADA